MFSIERDGMALSYFEDGCSSSCQQLRDDGYLGCPDICLFSATVRLEPGEIYTEGYNGLVHVPDTLPVECVTAPGGPADDESCFLRRQLSTGPTTFSATAGSAIDCDAALSPVGCECEPHPQGGCAYSGVPVSGDDLRASVEVDLGRDHGVYDGDQDVSSGAVTPIKIVFSN
jgi:hypothetical protein